MAVVHSSLVRVALAFAVADVKMAPVLDSTESDGFSVKKKEDSEDKENLW